MSPDQVTAMLMGRYGAGPWPAEVQAVATDLLTNLPTWEELTRAIHEAEEGESADRTAAAAAVAEEGLGLVPRDLVMEGRVDGLEEAMGEAMRSITNLGNYAEQTQNEHAVHYGELRGRLEALEAQAQEAARVQDECERRRDRMFGESDQFLMGLQTRVEELERFEWRTALARILEVEQRLELQAQNANEQATLLTELAERLVRLEDSQRERLDLVAELGRLRGELGRLEQLLPRSGELLPGWLNEVMRQIAEVREKGEGWAQNLAALTKRQDEFEQEVAAFTLALTGMTIRAAAAEAPPSSSEPSPPESGA